MLPSFDPRAICLVGACTAVLAGLTFAGLQPMYRRAVGPLRRYAGAMALIATALALLSVRGAMPDALTHTGANALACAGIVVCADATMRLFDRRQPAWSLGVQIAGVVSLALWLGHDPERLQARVVAVSAVQFASSAAVVWVLARAPAWRSQRYVRPLGVLFAGYGSGHLLRGAAAALGEPAAAGAIAPGAGQTVFVLLFALTPIALALLIQMTLHARVSGELHRRATTDELTGLHTRGRFFDLARERLRRGQGGR